MTLPPMASQAHLQQLPQLGGGDELGAEGDGDHTAVTVARRIRHRAVRQRHQQPAVHDAGGVAMPLGDAQPEPGVITLQ